MEDQSYKEPPLFLRTPDNGYHPTATATSTVVQVQAPLPRRIVSPVPEGREAGGQQLDLDSLAELCAKVQKQNTTKTQTTTHTT